MGNDVFARASHGAGRVSRDAVEGATVTNAELQLVVHLLEERSTAMAAGLFLSALPIEARFVLR